MGGGGGLTDGRRFLYMLFTCMVPSYRSNIIRWEGRTPVTLSEKIELKETIILKLGKALIEIQIGLISYKLIENI